MMDVSKHDNIKVAEFLHPCRDRQVLKMDSALWDSLVIQLSLVMLSDT
jgi:hypothetical protein